MSFTVAGSLDGTLYEVEVTGNAGSPVVGSRRVTDLVEEFTGETVLVTPHGPAYKVSPGDAESVLALLSSETKVYRVGEGAPVLVDGLESGQVR